MAITSTKYFIYPFAINGDKATILNPTQVTGVVSYQEGFTSDYEKTLGVDPDARPIPRDQSNQLYYDITTNIQQYQQYGVPFWISSADNGGSPFAYPKYARVLYDDGSGLKVYISLIASNTTTPSQTGSSWMWADGSYSCSVYNGGTNLSLIGNAGASKVPFSSARSGYDLMGMWNNTSKRIVALIPGLYEVTVNLYNINYTGTNAASGWIPSIYVNGIIGLLGPEEANFPTGSSCSFSRQLRLAATDYVEVYAQQNGGVGNSVIQGGDTGSSSSFTTFDLSFLSQ